MVAEKLTKKEKKGMFFDPCFSSVLLPLSSTFAAKIFRILRLNRSLHDAKFMSYLSGFSGWINLSESMLKSVFAVVTILL